MPIEYTTDLAGVEAPHLHGFFEGWRATDRRLREPLSDGILSASCRCSRYSLPTEAEASAAS
jgi:hypothetical protein